MTPVGIADIRLDVAVGWAEKLGLPYEIVESTSSAEAAIGRGVMAIASDGDVLARLERVDVFIEASNAMEATARSVLTALAHGQHVVMMNYEADLMFGPFLAAEAHSAGRVYTVADGDQPTVIKRLVDDITLWGFDLAVAGNIKGYHDLYINPLTIAPEADKRGLDHKMCSSYTDGSKLCVEMAVLANGLGLSTAKPGMHGPRLKHVLEIFDHIDIPRIYEEQGPFVDYVLGAEPKGGVFVVGYTESSLQQNTLDWFPPEMGDGPFYLFYRPYHLGAIEAMNCVIEAALDGSARLEPDYGMRTNVFSYGKKDLKAGDMIDGMGGYASYGLIENLDASYHSHPGLPICIAEDVRLKRDIRRDEKIYLDDVEFDPTSFNFDLYRRSVELPPRVSEPVGTLIGSG